MPTRKLRSSAILALAVLALGVIGVRVALAHCDGLDGPVVQAAAAALRTGNVNLALIWVQEPDEAELRAAFEQALVVRRAGGDAQALADRAFYETVVRLHRAGEGAPYFGLKPAGRDLGPAIPAADRALESGVADPLEVLLADAVRRGIRERLQALRVLSRYDPNDLRAGRRYVEAYVEYIHYVERLHEAAGSAAAGHYLEAPH